MIPPLAFISNVSPSTVLLLFLLILLPATIAMFVFWLLALIDCTKRNFPDPNAKIIWILVIVFTGIIGALIYHFVGKESGTKP